MSTGILSKLKRAAGLLPLTGLMLLSAGWTNQLYPPAADLQASQRMAQKFAEAAQNSSEFEILHLDLADSQDWSFVLGRLRAAGKNSENSPELFKRLNFMRARALARKAAAAKDGFQTSDTVTVDNWCNHFFSWNEREPFTSNGVTTFYPSAQASCKDGSPYVFLDVTNIEVNEATGATNQVSSGAAEEYGNGRALRVNTVATLTADQNRTLRAESLMMAVGETLDQTSFITLRAAAMNTPYSFEFLHPRKVHTNAQQVEILACQLRGGSDCDYAVAGNSGGNLVAYPPTPTGVAAANPGQSTLNPADFWTFNAPYDYDKLYVPLRLTLNAGTYGFALCTFKSFARANMELITSNSARTCRNEASFVSSLPTGGRTINLNQLVSLSSLFNQAGSGTSPASCATTTIRNELTNYNIRIVGKLDCNGTERDFVATFPTLRDRLNKRTSSIFFWNSCMAEGTGVKLADGKVVPVEQVKNGDQVIADAQGNVLTVTDVARGNEHDPLFRLKDDAGHDVTLTEMHPVIKAGGEVVATKELKVKDQVKTDKGVATLTSIERVDPKGKRVYNLRLGTEQELLKVGKNGRTLFAGGFLVGDMGMQDELQMPKQEQPVAVLDRLPKAWHQDFQRRVVKQ